MEGKKVFLEKATSLREIIAKKKGLVVLLSILIILLSAALIINATKSVRTVSPAPAPQSAKTSDPAARTNDPAHAAAEDEKADVLPQTERMDEASGLHPPDPFVTPPLLMGVFLGGGGEDLAIIEVGGNAYIVAVGDMVAGLWHVMEISRHKVILELGNHETVLYLGM
ncbi:MAG: hypothetical protein AB1796_13840 [Bacillota bacterium]